MLNYAGMTDDCVLEVTNQTVRENDVIGREYILTLVCTHCDRKPFELLLLDSPCEVCNGKGGTITDEMQGEPPMTGYVEFFEACECLCDGKCPGCGNAGITKPIDDATIENIDDFVCEVCGWSFVRERFYDDELDYYEGDYHKLDDYEDQGGEDYNFTVYSY